MPIFDQSAYEERMQDKAITIDPERGIVIDPERGQWTSASNAEADLLCPARHRMQMGLTRESGPDAVRGERIHEARAKGDPIGLNAEETECYEQLEALERDILEQWGGTDSAYEVHQEERLWIEFDGGLRHSGKPDFVAVDSVDSRAVVIDRKSGRGDITESPSNLQLRDLAVLVATNYHVSEVTVAIAQPFQRPTLCTYDQQDLLKAMEEMEARVKASNDPQAFCVPGEKQCRYCLAKATCPEFIADAVAVPASTGVSNPNKDELGIAIARLSGERLSVLLGLMRLASDVAEEEVRKRLAAGQQVPGWKIGEPGSRETITDPNTVHERFIQRGGTTQRFLECITVTKGKLKDALKEVTGTKGKGLDSVMVNTLAECVETKETAGKLERA